MGWAPFHQKMLFSNYLIPLPVLERILDDLLELLAASQLYCCEDLLMDGMPSFLKQEPIRQNSAVIIQRLIGQDSTWVGFFEDSDRFYLRCFVERPEEISLGDVQCGSMELYGDDPTIERALKLLSGKYDGFFLTRGAKQYLRQELIM